MKRIFILLLIVTSIGIYSESLDPIKLEKITSFLTQIRHTNDVDWKNGLESIDPNPVPYLENVIASNTVRTYVKGNAIEALKALQSKEADTLLIKVFGDANGSKNLRKSAIRVYAEKNATVNESKTKAVFSTTLKEKEFLDFSTKQIDTAKSKKQFQKQGSQLGKTDKLLKKKTD